LSSEHEGYKNSGQSELNDTRVWCRMHRVNGRVI